MPHHQRYNFVDILQSLMYSFITMTSQEEPRRPWTQVRGLRFYFNKLLMAWRMAAYSLASACIMNRISLFELIALS